MRLWWSGSRWEKSMNESKNKITLFDNREVRQLWNDETEKWWFSVVDVIEILTDQPSHDRARKYWSVMKTRLKQEGAEPTTICSQLKMQAHDGKMRLTDVAATDISQVRNPEGFVESAEVAKEGAKTAKAARLQLEKSTGKPVVSKLNAKQLAAQQLESDVDRSVKQLTQKAAGKNNA